MEGLTGSDVGETAPVLEPVGVTGETGATDVPGLTDEATGLTVPVDPAGETGLTLEPVGEIPPVV